MKFQEIKYAQLSKVKFSRIKEEGKEGWDAFLGRNSKKERKKKKRQDRTGENSSKQYPNNELNLQVDNFKILKFSKTITYFRMKIQLYHSQKDFDKIL